MKVGDLVKYIGDDTATGLIVGRRPRSFIYDVIIRGVTYPFLPSQLEVISESR